MIWFQFSLYFILIKGLNYGFCAPKDCSGNEIASVVGDVIDKASTKINKYIKNGDVLVSCNKPAKLDVWTYLGV